MSMQLYIGASGSGKSQRLYKEIIDMSMANPDGHFYIIVPDQFNMETQKNLVLSHPDKGIMNIEVLSFSRLAHRVFEETGDMNLPVLDDTGKNLILRRLISVHENELGFLNGKLKNPGYVHEVKSSISEFMQYGIDAAALKDIADYSRERKSLAVKLADLGILYDAFLKEIEGRFVTTEGIMGKLELAVSKWERIKGAVVVFDGFTGFTPIQLRVIGEILKLADLVKIAVIMEPEADDELFSFSRKMIRSLERLADDYKVESLPYEYIESSDADMLWRFKTSPALARLERNLFRKGTALDDKPCRPVGISIYEAPDPETEVRHCCSKIRKLIREDGLEYRDVAVVAGDLSAYAELIKDTFREYDIPVFMDSTRKIIQNPFTEFIKNALNVVIRDFSYESVFTLLRCGFMDIDREDTDKLENFVLKYAIRGKKTYSKPFVIKNSESDLEAEDLQKSINRVREELLAVLLPVLDNTGKRAADHTDCLYEMITASKAYEKLLELEETFKNEGDMLRASEYGRIYKLVMELLEQIYALIGDEEMSLSEYLEILEAGFSEIKLGNIPQDVDRISVGDMERSRLKQIKVLFFLGVNDGNIPGHDKGGGLISDIDREFLAKGSFEMAPGPREQMVIQKLYLYMNMTKPDTGLVISYARRSAKGESLRPSYLIREVRRIFPDITIEKTRDMEAVSKLEHPGEAVNIFSGLIRDYAQGVPCDQEYFKQLYKSIKDMPGYGEYLKSLVDAAFYKYESRQLSPEAVEALYGRVIKGSVSRLEKYSECAFRYFLQYGLGLKEREEFGFKAVDMGSVCHRVLESFSKKLLDENKNLKEFDDGDCDRLLESCINDIGSEYKDNILLTDERHKYIFVRIKRIMRRTVIALRDQLKKGDFSPVGFEAGFSRLMDIDMGQGKAGGKMQLSGSIDRYDTAETGDGVLVRILDYKTGDRKVDAGAVYYGLQLQLAVYLGEALRMLKDEYKDKAVIPAGLLYFRMQDPVVNQEKELSEEGIYEELKGLLRMEGVVCDKESILKSMDREFTTRSQVIPVTRKADGSLDRFSHAIGEGDMDTIISYAENKLPELGKRILEGHMEKAPYMLGKKNGCMFCPYKGVCGFDTDIAGYEYRKLNAYDDDEAISLMESQKPDPESMGKEE